MDASFDEEAAEELVLTQVDVALLVLQLVPQEIMLQEMQELQVVLMQEALKELVWVIMVFLHHHLFLLLQVETAAV